MRITKNGVDRVITTFAAASASVLPTLVDNKVITIHVAVTIGSIITAVVAAYHGSAVVSNIPVVNPDVNNELNSIVKSHASEPEA